MSFWDLIIICIIGTTIINNINKNIDEKTGIIINVCKENHK